MLKIRTEQVNEFERADAPYFETRLIAHLKEAFPKHCGFLGEAGVAETARYGIAKAAEYGFTRQAGAKLYADLLLLVGRGFDTDLQLPWAAEVLNEKTDEAAKAQRLHAQATTYLNRVSGPDNEFIDKAQSRIAKEKIDVPSQPGQFGYDTLERLKEIWPEKYEYLGEDRTKDLVRHCVSAAKTYGMGTERGLLVYTGLAYMMGAGFDRDPLVKWAGEILNDKQTDGAERAEKLYAEALNYLKQWCAECP